MVTVTIERKVSGISKFDTGITHEHYSLDAWGDAKSIAAGKALLARCCKYQCQAIMGWGTDNPNPAPGKYDWSTLDARMALIRSFPKAIPVITLCAAPDWMKGGEPGKTDWSKIEVAPLPEHYDDFTELSRRVAERYPEVTYFQVWNEFKGFWNDATNNWDYVRYTELYNKVYDALKSVRKTIKVGGPYLVLEGDGIDPKQWWGVKPITPRNQQVLDYWLANKRGADFITLDRGLIGFHNNGSHAARHVLDQTPLLGSICDQIRKKTDLPIWIAEMYGWTDKTGNRKLMAASYASLLYELVTHGATTALLWQPQDVTPPEWTHACFTDTRKPGGGKPYPLFDVLHHFHEHFGPGKALLKVTTSTSEILALATAQKTLLINRSDRPQMVQINRKATRTLQGYEVALIATP